MPFTLKKQLVNEWERVAKEPIHLIALPRAPCVAQVRVGCRTNYLPFK